MTKRFRQAEQASIATMVRTNALPQAGKTWPLTPSRRWSCTAGIPQEGCIRGPGRRHSAASYEDLDRFSSVYRTSYHTDSLQPSAQAVSTYSPVRVGFPVVLIVKSGSTPARLRNQNHRKNSAPRAREHNGSPSTQAMSLPRVALCLLLRWFSRAHRPQTRPGAAPVTTQCTVRRPNLSPSSWQGPERSWTH